MSNISRITKAVLATELATARARIVQLEGQLSAERANHARAMAAAPTAKALPWENELPSMAPVVRPAVLNSAMQDRAAHSMPQWQMDRAVAMAAARSMAIGARMVVKV